MLDVQWTLQLHHSPFFTSSTPTLHWYLHLPVSHSLKTLSLTPLATSTLLSDRTPATNLSSDFPIQILLMSHPYRPSFFYRNYRFRPEQKNPIASYWVCVCVCHQTSTSVASFLLHPIWQKTSKGGKTLQNCICKTLTLTSQSHLFVMFGCLGWTSTYTGTMVGLHLTIVNIPS
jgi:hypothetical protein